MQVWQRGGKAGTVASKGDGRAGDTLTKDFLRKYIHYAKSRVHPSLSETAMEVRHARTVYAAIYVLTCTYTYTKMRINVYTYTYINENIHTYTKLL